MDIIGACIVIACQVLVQEDPTVVTRRMLATFMGYAVYTAFMFVPCHSNVRKFRDCKMLANGTKDYGSLGNREKSGALLSMKACRPSFPSSLL